MASKFSVATTSDSIHFWRNPFSDPTPTSIVVPASLFLSSIRRYDIALRYRRRKRALTVCFVIENGKQSTQIENYIEEECRDGMGKQISTKIAFVMSSLGIISIAVMAVYYRFSWQMEGGEVPLSEMFCTFAFSVAAASHHKPREGPFELNDVFAIFNAVPAIALLNFGFFHKGLIPGLCFGAGLGITVLGMAYVFIHDGLVHRRFPVGPIAKLPYIRKVAAAHQLHHSNKFEGLPYGFFLGPKELEDVGGLEELEMEIKKRINLF